EVFFSSGRRHTRWPRDWSSDVCSSDLVTTDGAWFYQEPEGKRLARLARGTIVVGGESRDAWQGVTLEGWIFATSVGPTPRAGYDLAVTRAPEENLRSASAGALIGKLPQGFPPNKVAEG